MINLALAYSTLRVLIKNKFLKDCLALIGMKQKGRFFQHPLCTLTGDIYYAIYNNITLRVLFRIHLRLIHICDDKTSHD